MARDTTGTTAAALEAKAEGVGGVRLLFRGALDAGAVARSGRRRPAAPGAPRPSPSTSAA
jgi:hypothetical protein